MRAGRPQVRDHARRDGEYSFAAPAPQGYVPEPASAVDSWSIESGPPRPQSVKKERPGLREFYAELDAAELGDMFRPGSTWTARAHALNRSTLVLTSRRMVHQTRLMIVAVHLIDAEPVPLMGRVAECEYEAYSLHRIVLDLLPIPESDLLAAWLNARAT